MAARKPRRKREPLTMRGIWLLMAVISAGLMAGAWRGVLRVDEVFGFITGAVCVLLVVRQNIWNFPVGIANNVFFILLFVRARLYGDMALQGVYIALALHGWHQWLYGGQARTALRVGRASLREGLALGAGGIAATAGMRVYFIRLGDAAPFLDALTTVLSLVAQYLLNRKRVENWYVWITADVLYIGIYLARALCLTAALYLVFIGMCLMGLEAWKRALPSAEGTEPAARAQQEVKA
ncbi:MAG: nicotinamide mononucleotide transporter [Armatimonadetes bacterium]|nr:nicotinamide mononucleotide transporter [Armatimonadota bacterium]